MFILLQVCVLGSSPRWYRTESRCCRGLRKPGYLHQRRETGCLVDWRRYETVGPSSSRRGPALHKWRLGMARECNEGPTVIVGSSPHL